MINILSNLPFNGKPTLSDFAVAIDLNHNNKDDRSTIFRHIDTVSGDTHALELVAALVVYSDDETYRGKGVLEIIQDAPCTLDELMGWLENRSQVTPGLERFEVSQNPWFEWNDESNNGEPLLECFSDIHPDPKDNIELYQSPNGTA